ncbi:MAG TPA: ribonuclease HI family protein [Terriglobales bacterium]|jgi:ribonuclease HI|nr:ribonuclease HI family protein [Terriglobales bacterium]
MKPAPQNHLIAHTDGGARGNPGPAGYGVIIRDALGNKIAALSQYLGRQTNNFAEYQALIAALEYAAGHGPKALKVISDSELLVRQMKGIYKVKEPTLRDLHARANQLVRHLDWFEIEHVLRGQNKEADQLANEAMDKGSGRAPLLSASPTAQRLPQEFEGVVRNGKIELLDGSIPDGTAVQVRVKR